MTVSAASVVVSATSCAGCVMDRVAGKIAMTISPLSVTVTVRAPGRPCMVLVLATWQAAGRVRLRAATLAVTSAERETSPFLFPLGTAR